VRSLKCSAEGFYLIITIDLIKSDTMAKQAGFKEKQKRPSSIA